MKTLLLVSIAITLFNVNVFAQPQPSDTHALTAGSASVAPSATLAETMPGGTQPFQYSRRDILAPIVGVIGIVLVVGAFFFFQQRKYAQRHQTLRLMVEKGVPIPPELLMTSGPRSADLRRGVVLVAAGLGLGASMLFAGRQSMSAIALIPVFVGAGFLLIWTLQRNDK